MNTSLLLDHGSFYKDASEWEADVDIFESKIQNALDPVPELWSKASRAFFMSYAGFSISEIYFDRELTKDQLIILRDYLKSFTSYWIPCCYSRAFFNSVNALVAYKNEKYKSIPIVGDKLEEINSYSCNHTWQKYVGLVQSYEYCSICDLKR